MNNTTRTTITGLTLIALATLPTIIATTLHLNIDFSEIMFWTFAAMVLAWITTTSLNPRPNPTPTPRLTIGADKIHTTPDSTTIDGLELTGTPEAVQNAWHDLPNPHHTPGLEPTIWPHHTQTTNTPPDPPQ
jgi:hypothetical protein